MKTCSSTAASCESVFRTVSVNFGYHRRSCCPALRLSLLDERSNLRVFMFSWKFFLMQSAAMMFFRNISSPILKFNKVRLKKTASFQQSAIHASSSGPQVTVEELPNITTDSFVSTSQIRKCLKDHEAKFENGFTCITTRCINCFEKREGLIYINKRTGISQLTLPFSLLWGDSNNLFFRIFHLCRLSR